MAEAGPSGTVGLSVPASLSAAGGTGTNAPSTSAASRRPRRPAGTGFVRSPGRRVMKEYPLTEGEMRELGAVGVITTLLFSLGTGCWGFVLNVSMNVAFSSGIPKDVLIFWSTLRCVAIISAIILYICGIIGFIYGGYRVTKIKRGTEHDDQKIA